MEPTLIFDAHLDLAMNAIEWNRDLTRPVEEVREREHLMTDKPDRGKNTVTFPEMRKGNIGICVATLIARYAKPGNPFPGWHSPEQAWAMTQGQLAWYKAMEKKGELKQITCLNDLENHLNLWNKKETSKLPIGYILSLEGADSLYQINMLEKAWKEGLRAIGPAHYGPGTYAHGTDSEGSLGEKGKQLLKAMDELHMILDITHLSDQSFFEALDIYQGPVWASHHNCRSLVPHNRQLSDQQINMLIEHGSVIGIALDAWMLVPGWKRGIDTPQSRNVTLQHVADHLDHICQLAGNSLHAGIGSDLDGAFGKEQSPLDLETIADLQKLHHLLACRGYREEDISNIFHGNFLRFIRKIWTESKLYAK
ncbi:MAG TPA: membrane dipeptidase [Bacteroidales bacterium]|nr:membrane dipeptidase [Bacteroidales bacterium]